MKADEENDLYEILGITSSASKLEIKKAYHKAALAHHPDKAAEGERAEAEIRFKTAKQAYEILSDDQKRSMYDAHGMAAFDPSSGMRGPDVEDIFAQMFGFGGMPGMSSMPGAHDSGNTPRKGRSVEEEYEVTLEELYRGKTTKFSTTKNIVCSTCKGSGGKQGAKSHVCGICKGRGTKSVLRQIGPGLVTQETAPCGNCGGSGRIVPEKQRCRKCRGQKIIESKKVVELYIPRGARQGDRITLAGEADQLPSQEPGDIVFILKETPHKVFERAGADLRAELRISLVEALTGFNRVILTHLDGRGIQLNIQQPAGKILRPGQILKIPGEGMPMKRSDAKGDLFLLVEIEFPEDGWFKNDTALQKIRDVLPPLELANKETPDDVDDVEVVWDAYMEDFGAGSGDPRAGGDWEDEDDDDDEAAGPQCATQ